MKSLSEAARWVFLARQPKATHSAVRMALFPLPFCPVMKLTCSPSSMWRLEWHMKFSSRMREIVPAIAAALSLLAGGRQNGGAEILRGFQTLGVFFIGKGGRFSVRDLGWVWQHRESSPGKRVPWEDFYVPCVRALQQN
uniref:Uncharacterized protein n=1 Tax=Arundo donax TaxID=35708 RepID=A0A0A9FAK0_ARUDO